MAIAIPVLGWRDDRNCDPGRRALQAARSPQFTYPEPARSTGWTCPMSASETAVRFVVLAHDVPGEGRHFDLMIEFGESLATWKGVDAPEAAQASPVSLRRIQDHRLHYLAYEGPISGNRGSVARHDEGACRVIGRSDECWNLEFKGRHLYGRFELRRIGTESQSWSLAACPKCDPNG